jgi:lysophospholipid acyltransferase (LPLAT)-like uncharacterized protein
LRIRNRFVNWLLVASVVLLCRLLFRTLRIRFLCADPASNPYGNEAPVGYIYCVWHDAIAFPIFAGRHTRTVALVSRHQDGSYLASGLKMLGIGLVRGSSNHQGATAVRELLRLPRHFHVVVTPDGPRGPRRQIKPGLVFLAGHSGRMIVPTAFAATRVWRVRGSWTDLLIPMPYAEVVALSGQPLSIPSDATGEQLLEAERLLQAEMDRLTALAERLIQAPLHEAARVAALAELRTVQG